MEKLKKNISETGNQYFIFQSQCHIPHQLHICHLLVFYLSKVILFFLLGFTIPLSVWLSSEDSLITGAFLFFLCLSYHFTVAVALLRRFVNFFIWGWFVPLIFFIFIVIKWVECRHELCHFGMGNVAGTFENCDFRNRNLRNTQYYETSLEGLYLDSISSFLEKLKVSQIYSVLCL